MPHLIKKYLSVTAAFFILGIAIIYSKSLSQGLQNGLQLCLNSLIPSLFMFMVLSSFFMRTGIGSHMFFFLNRPLSSLFQIPVQSVPVFCFSLLGGFPVGARLLADQVETGEIERETASRMLAYCVNCGPAFLISAVSIPIFHNYTIGVVVYLSQILASLGVGALMRGSIKKEEKQTQHSLPVLSRPLSFSTELVNTVRSTIESMALICAFVLIFSGISQILQDTGFLEIISSKLSVFMTEEIANSLIIGLLEVTSGCHMLQKSQSLLLFALLTGFGGLCVHIQIKAIISHSKITMKYFYRYRPIYLIFSLFSSMFLIRLFGGTAMVFAKQPALVPTNAAASPIASLLLIFLSIMLLCSGKKSDIIKYNN